jgi:hypothetical protein
MVVPRDLAKALQRDKRVDNLIKELVTSAKTSEEERQESYLRTIYACFARGGEGATDTVWQPLYGAWAGQGKWAGRGCVMGEGV